MIRTLLVCLALGAAASAQLIPLDPSLVPTTVAINLPGPQHQLGTDAAGNIYVGEEYPGGFTTGHIHRVQPGGTVNIQWINGALIGIASIGQMVTNPADGACYFLNHWQGALEHNHITRIEPGGSLTVLNDILWGIGHGLAIDASGDMFVGVGMSFFSGPQIHRVPAGSPPWTLPILWAPGQGENAFLAPGAPGSLLVADGPAIWQVVPGLPDVQVWTPTIAGGSTFGAWRGLIPSPFGPGHVVSYTTVDTASGATTGHVVAFGGGPDVPIAIDGGATNGDMAITAGGPGALLVISEGTLYHLQQIPAPCAAGNVGVGAGGPFDVLLVNGTAGGITRTVTAPAGSPLALDVVTAPTSPAAADIIVWGELGWPAWSSAFSSPIGDFCIVPDPISPAPVSFTVTNSWTPLAGLLPPSTAPWTAMPVAPFPVQFLLQGVIEDQGSVAVTNAVRVDVQ